MGDLTFDSAGNLYGVTTNGGQHNRGTVYKLTRSNSGWTESIVDSFGIIYGDPEAGVTLGGDGNLYGTLAYANGSPPCCYGAIYRLERSGSGWTEHILYILGTGGQDDGGYPYSGVVFDSAGNLYGATTTYGANGGGTVFELSLSGSGWSYSVLYSLAGGIRGPGPYGTLMFDQSGNLYGTTVAGGANMLGNVFKLSRSGDSWSYTSVYDFNDPSVAGYPYSNVVFDAGGNLYGTFSLGGALGSCQQGCGGVWEITP